MLHPGTLFGLANSNVGWNEDLSGTLPGRTPRRMMLGTGPDSGFIIVQVEQRCDGGAWAGS